MYRLLLLAIFLLAVTHITAQQKQHRLVVCDIETRVPIRGVIVSTENGYRDTSNYRGICYVPDDFDTLVVSKASYLSEVMFRKDLKDTTYLIPEGKSIGEVTVWGKTTIKDKVNRWKRNTTVLNSSSGLSFDFANILDKRGRRDRKHLRITKEKFKEMDDSEDPIEKAYNQAMEEQRRKKEQKEREKEEQQKEGQQKAKQPVATASTTDNGDTNAK